MKERLKEKITFGTDCERKFIIFHHFIRSAVNQEMQKDTNRIIWEKEKYLKGEYIGKSWKMDLDYYIAKARQRFPEIDTKYRALYAICERGQKMQNKLQQLKQQALREIEQAENAADLGKLEIKYLGRKGELSGLMRGLGELSAEERPKAGALANEVKKVIVEAVSVKLGQLKSGSSAQMDFLDVTAPGVKQPEGHLHLVTQAIKEISEIFTKIGFYRVQYSEVESDWYAFESLNMPPDHPARDEWETFFLESGNGQKGDSKLVLTPHTSSGQAREMFRRKPPIRMINIAKCYRRQIDVSHTPMFHQFEGLYIDKKVTIGHLKGVFDYFGEQYFGKGRVTRLRPSHFQFTEPSFEVDIKCGLCLGEGCKMCKEGWLELGGSGMVHPNVLKAGGVDPKKYNGFAFGWGVERTLLMKGGLAVDDIRVLYKNDLRFLEQF